MPTEQLSNDLYDYEDWDTTAIPLPPRSQLHHLTPIGVGTGAVESLNGYLVRLAGSHAVSLHALAGKMIAPALGPDRAWWAGTKINVFFRTSGGAISGRGETAEDWATALATLTRRDDLRALTLLPLAGVLAERGLMRATPAWCPACYQAWLDDGEIPYQPLLWHLQVITACPRHRRTLLDRCPEPGCGRPQVPRSTAMRPGFCTACSAWLGTDAPPTPAETPDATALAWQGWATEAVGALLADAATRRPPLGGEAVVAAVGAAVAHLGGNSKLARATDLPVMRITAWRQGRQLPSLPLLLQFCDRLGTTPLRLLTERPLVLGAATPLAPVTPPRTRRVGLDRERLRAALAAQVREPDDPPPSLEELARRLGCTSRSLTLYAPADARAISARWLAQRARLGVEASEQRRAEVRRVTLARIDAGLGTSATEVKAALPDPAMWWTPDAEAARVAALMERGAMAGLPLPTDEDLVAGAATGAATQSSRRQGAQPAPPLLLSDEERQALTAAIATEGASARGRRIRAILLLEQGQASPAVAAAVDASEKSVHAWAGAWRERGMAGLADPARHGPAPLLDEAAEHLLREWLVAGPQEYGHRAANWTLPLLHREVLAAGYTVSREPVRRLAVRLGWRPAPQEPDPDRPPLVRVTDQEHDSLVAAVAAEGREPLRRRLQTILLLAQGQAPEAVARALGVNRTSVYNWAQDWREAGLVGLASPRGAPGVPLLDAGAERLLMECLATAPAAYGHPAARWTLPLLQAELAKGGYAASAATVRRKAWELGWRRE